jgi:hypothetical protein
LGRILKTDQKEIVGGIKFLWDGLSTGALGLPGIGKDHVVLITTRF